MKKVKLNFRKGISMKKKLKKILKIIIAALLLSVISISASFIGHVMAEFFPTGSIIIAVVLILIWAYLLVSQNEQ